MPVAKFGYYSLVLGHIEDYYKIGAKNKARNLSKILIEKYQENLEYFAQFSQQELNLVFDEIESNLRQYQNLVQTAISYDDDKYANSIKDAYIGVIDLYKDLIE